MKIRNSAQGRTIYFSLLRTIFLMIALALCFFTASMVVGSAWDGGSDVVTNIEADLAGAAVNGFVPRGEAEAKTFVDGNRKFEVNLLNLNRPDGTILNVSVDGARVGTIRLVGMLGELDLETANGQTVPQINSRTRIVVSDQAGNTVVAGAFSNIPTPGATPTPTPSGTPSPTPSPGPIGETRLEARLAGAPINGLLPKRVFDLAPNPNQVLVHLGALDCNCPAPSPYGFQIYRQGRIGGEE